MHILTPKGKIGSHSFDVFGTLLDMEKMGTQQIELYKEAAQQEGLAAEVTAQHIKDYKGIMRDDEELRERRGEIVSTINRLNTKYGLMPDAREAIYKDVIPAFGRILDKGEGVVIISSGRPEIIQPALPQEMIEQMRFYEGNKNIANFLRVYASEQAAGAQLISHTGDELGELEGARDSKLFTNMHESLIYLARGKNPKQKIIDAGFRTEHTLDTICYTQER